MSAGVTSLTGACQWVDEGKHDPWNPEVIGHSLWMNGSNKAARDVLHIVTMIGCLVLLNLSQMIQNNYAYNY